MSKMKTICVHSYKGGTGKTTFLLNIAGILAKKGKTILAIDYDLRAPSFQSYFKMTKQSFLSHYLLEEKTIKEIIFPCKIDEKANLDLIFSSMEFLKQHSTQRDKLSRDDAKYLAKMFNLQKSLEEKYDFMLIDTIPGFFYRSIDSMIISDIILLIATPSTSNVLGIEELCSNIYSVLKDETKMILIINKIEDEGVDADKEIFEENLAKLRVIGKNKFSHVIEVPYYNILSERIHAFEVQPQEEFLESLLGVIELFE
ncbi:MAG: AAA family ATPase [Candidatus Heimdallarchaeota archaeon]|nr:AAA family ATPase [Candidatus Heimdallarchaeota archaeon]